MAKKKYYVKFVKSKYLPDFTDDNALQNYKINLGTFHYYRDTEDQQRKDTSEGQRGLHLKLKRPCDKLIELSKTEPALPDPRANLDANGNFIADYFILAHDHLAEYNAYVFCVSAIDDLDELETLKDRFKCDSYYFLSDVDGYFKSIARSLGIHLKL